MVTEIGRGWVILSEGLGVGSQTVAEWDPFERTWDSVPCHCRATGGIRWLWSLGCGDRGLGQVRGHSEPKQPLSALSQA